MKKSTKNKSESLLKLVNGEGLASSPAGRKNPTRWCRVAPRQHGLPDEAWGRRVAYAWLVLIRILKGCVEFIVLKGEPLV